MYACTCRNNNSNSSNMALPSEQLRFFSTCLLICLAECLLHCKWLYLLACWQESKYSHLQCNKHSARQISKQVEKKRNCSEGSAMLELLELLFRQVHAYMHSDRFNRNQIYFQSP